MFTNRRLAVALVMFALLLIGGASLQAQENVTVRLWMHEHPPRVPLDEELVAQFMQENPGITVDYQVIPNADYDTRLATAFAAGSGPDLFNQWTNFIGNNYAQGLIAPLDPVAAGYNSIDDVFAAYQSGDTILSGAVFNDTLYGLPTEVSNFTCYANDDLFAAAGLDAATDFPATWEDMITTAQTLTVRDSNGVLMQRGFDFNWTSPILLPLIFEPMVRQLGGLMIDEANNTANINSPEVAQVMGYWNDWVNTYQLGGPQYTGSRDAFLAGELAMDCSFGNWGVPQMVDAGINYSIHPLPRFANGVSDNGLAIYAFFFQVNANSSPEVQAAAWKLAGYLTSFPDRYFNEAGLFQPKVEFVQTEAFQQDPIMQVFFDEAQRSYYMPRMAPQEEVNQALARARDRIILGGEALQTVLDEADVEIDGILANAAGR